MSVSMIVNIVMIALLIITNIYALMLNSRLKKIRNARDELQIVIQRFAEATSKAHNSIETLKKAATQVEGNIFKQISRAEELQSDLSFFIKRGDEIAGRLEELILAYKTGGKTPPSGEQSAGKQTPKDPQTAILKAIKDMK